MALLVSIKSTLSLLSEIDRRNQRYHKQEKKTPNKPHLRVKVKVSHSLIAVGAVGLESHRIKGTAKERRSQSRSFRCLIFSLIQKSYPFTAGLTEKVF